MFTETALLTVAEMGRADKAAVARGVPSLLLMESAGTAVANAIRRRFTRRPVLVACGPGNNGGDGFVIARLLARKGWPVTVALLGDPAKLTGDARVNFERWRGPVKTLCASLLETGPLVVDALFGAGLTRDLEGVALDVVEAINARGLDCVAVDLPSGVAGDTGAIKGAAPRCTLTVTFFRMKPGHVLYPGRAFCGETVLADIGIPEGVLGDEVSPAAAVNAPSLWTVPEPGAEDHKYRRGHAVVVGGGSMTGAGRLAARAARRIGAGMLTIAAPLPGLYGLSGRRTGEHREAGGRRCRPLRHAGGRALQCRPSGGWWWQGRGVGVHGAGGAEPGSVGGPGCGCADKLCRRPGHAVRCDKGADGLDPAWGRVLQDFPRFER